SRPRPCARPLRARRRDRPPARSRARRRGASASGSAPDRRTSIYIYLLNLHLSMLRIGAMERVAVITDIHGNLPALEAALARVEELAVGATYCGGDLVGYGPWPNEVCRLIEERRIPTIHGNYDYAIGR